MLIFHWGWFLCYALFFCNVGELSDETKPPFLLFKGRAAKRVTGKHSKCKCYSLSTHFFLSVSPPQGAVPKGNATKEFIESLQLKPGQVVYKCPKCCSIKPDRAHHCRYDPPGDCGEDPKPTIRALCSLLLRVCSCSRESPAPPSRPVCFIWSCCVAFPLQLDEKEFPVWLLGGVPGDPEALKTPKHCSVIEL